VKAHSISRWILIADLSWCLAALFGAEALRYGAFWTIAQRASAYGLVPFFGITVVLWVLLSSWMKLDCFRGGWHFPAVVSRVLLAVTCLMSVLLSAGYLRREYVSRLALTYFGVILFLGFVAIRCGARVLLLARSRAGRVRRLVIVGSDHIARELAAKIRRHPEMACEVIGFLCPEDEGNLNLRPSALAESMPTLAVIDLLSSRGISDLILALPKPALPEILNLVGRCRDRGIKVSFIPQPYELYLSRPSLVDLDGIPILELREICPSNFYFRCKRTCDIVLGLSLSILAVPILLPAAIGLRCKKGKAFCWETRCGYQGRSFSMLRLNVDRYATAHTGFEGMLESIGLTELPQLWNVLRSEMSLVGPRPESPERAQHYSEWQQQRLSIKPGMTGLAQVHGLRDQNSSEEKARFDLQYILNPSAIADISILLQTLWTLAMRLFEHPRSLRKGSGVVRNNLLDKALAAFLKDTLPDAHRSQSSAD
jgi:lipopolysaccharide/colanic/teichoic acid biosynthesis glycosyltransferase